MEVVKHIDEKTRIVLKWYLPALDTVFALQRKKRIGWKTTAWNYPSVVKVYTWLYIEKYLFWSENRNTKNELEIGRDIMKQAK